MKLYIIKVVRKIKTVKNTQPNKNSEYFITKHPLLRQIETDIYIQTEFSIANTSYRIMANKFECQNEKKRQFNYIQMNLDIL